VFPSPAGTPDSVDRNAPVLAHHEIDISAPVSRVWALHQDAIPAGTHVATTESLAGAPVEADVAGMQRVLDGSLVSWLNHLKNAAEAAG
jgi:hypothetical protein